jgi:hypothetical protein
MAGTIRDDRLERASERRLPGVKVVADGRVAEATLRRFGIDADEIRHPSMGGANLFRDGLVHISALVLP